MCVSQLCSDVIVDGCSAIGLPNALTTVLSGSVMSAALDRPFFQVAP